jgi:RsiW-degrading membrane proteinase PrsW (M82 family)
MRVLKTASPRGRSLTREIVVVLFVKTIVLTLIWFAFFSRPAIRSLPAGMDPAAVGAAILGRPAQAHR